MNTIKRIPAALAAAYRAAVPKIKSALNKALRVMGGGGSGPIKPS